jgi:hypothetical protein
MVFRSAFVMLAIGISSGCAPRNDLDNTQRAAAAAVSPGAADALERRLGWTDDACLAIANPALAVDTPIVVVSLDAKPPALVDGRIVASTDSSEICAPLRDERRAANMVAGAAFYEVMLSDTVKSGIAVVGTAKRVGGGLDVDGDGRSEIFTQCVTSEGVSYQVWRDVAYQGKALWSGYYYLGYDTEPTCPSSR